MSDFAQYLSSAAYLYICSNLIKYSSYLFFIFDYNLNAIKRYRYFKVSLFLIFQLMTKRFV